MAVLSAFQLLSAQNMVIKMTSAAPVGTTISFQLQAADDYSTATVDFGGGTQVETTVRNIPTNITGVLGEKQTITVIAPAIITYLDCHGSMLTDLDVTGCNTLNWISCDNNQLKSIDVSKNTALEILSCHTNQLDYLDLSKNTYLNYLHCHHNNLSIFNIRNNPKLANMDCSYNGITNLETDNNPVLQILLCNNNKLSGMDLTNNSSMTLLHCENNNIYVLTMPTTSKLDEIYCYNNRLNFSSLPPKGTMLYYHYAPQQKMEIAKSCTAGNMFDFYAPYAINGSPTTTVWQTKGGRILEKGTDYNEDGKFEFLKAPGDSVYCVMACETFADLTGDKAYTTTMTWIAPVLAKLPDTNLNNVVFTGQPGTIGLNLPGNANVSVFTSKGTLTGTYELTEGTNTLQVPAKGVYLVKVSTGSTTATHKVAVL